MVPERPLSIPSDHARPSKSTIEHRAAAHAQEKLFSGVAEKGAARKGANGVEEQKGKGDVAAQKAIVKSVNELDQKRLQKALDKKENKGMRNQKLPNTAFREMENGEGSQPAIKERRLKRRIDYDEESPESDVPSKRKRSGKSLTVERERGDENSLAPSRSRPKSTASASHGNRNGNRDTSNGTASGSCKATQDIKDLSPESLKMLVSLRRFLLLRRGEANAGELRAVCKEMTKGDHGRRKEWLEMLEEIAYTEGKVGARIWRLRRDYGGGAFGGI
ncbi:hypothetical protein RUND412_000674 [Rhizina undulata]